MRTMHVNSITAYRGVNISKKQSEVLAALETLGQATDQQIADHLGTRLNCVTGRITELKGKGVVVEDHSVIGESGRPIRVSRLKNMSDTLF